MPDRKQPSAAGAESAIVAQTDAIVIRPAAKPCTCLAHEACIHDYDMPSSPTSLPAELQQAYANALYRVFDATGSVHTLHVGQRSPWLQQAYAVHRCASACYLTACNPQGKHLSDAENTERMEQLRTALHSQGWCFEAGQGQDPNEQWPGEDSVLIWGMDEATATAWGRQWQQNALLFCGADAMPQLLWLR